MLCLRRTLKNQSPTKKKALNCGPPKSNLVSRYASSVRDYITISQTFPHSKHTISRPERQYLFSQPAHTDIDHLLRSYFISPEQSMLGCGVVGDMVSATGCTGSCHHMIHIQKAIIKCREQPAAKAEVVTAPPAAEAPVATEPGQGSVAAAALLRSCLGSVQCRSPSLNYPILK
eukprot:209297-Amorphochlora_amoeboformis.AAC.2